jgi:[ribosomal protein S5]-alanine N-acetyltransferase
MSESIASFHAPERFETARLLLRRPVMADARPMFENYCADPEVTRYVLFEPHTDIATTRAFLRRCAGVWQRGTAFPWVLASRATGKLVGGIEIRPEPGSPHRIEVGYVLARPYWGQGYMTEALRAVSDWALHQPGVRRVWAECDLENVGSARVMEKSGFEREGVLRCCVVFPNLGPEPRDVARYARVR